MNESGESEMKKRTTNVDPHKKKKELTVLENAKNEKKKKNSALQPKNPQRWKFH